MCRGACPGGLYGIGIDNRIENLELWVKPQPTGIRVSDAVKWAQEVLEVMLQNSYMVVIRSFLTFIRTGVRFPATPPDELLQWGGSVSTGRNREKTRPIVDEAI